MLPVDVIEQDTFMIVKATTSKAAYPDKLRSVLSTNYKKNPDNKTAFNKACTLKKKGNA